MHLQFTGWEQQHASSETDHLLTNPHSGIGHIGNGLAYESSAPIIGSIISIGIVVLVRHNSHETILRVIGFIFRLVMKNCARIRMPCNSYNEEGVVGEGNRQGSVSLSCFVKHSLPRLCV